MNDKNFIEELRQKREEYGVTQTRLAVGTERQRLSANGMLSAGTGTLMV